MQKTDKLSALFKFLYVYIELYSDYFLTSYLHLLYCLVLFWCVCTYISRIYFGCTGLWKKKYSLATFHSVAEIIIKAYLIKQSVICKAQ